MYRQPWYGITRSDYCKNPKLFRPSYWGSASIRGVESPIFPKDSKDYDLKDLKIIIQNRNWIEKEFKLKRNCKGTAPQYVNGYDVCEQIEKDMRRWFDHMEIYSAPGGWVMFLSPYGCFDEPVPEGWERTRPIYTLDASTIYKFIPGRGATAKQEVVAKNAVVIQRQFRKARYHPKYKLCKAVLFRNLERDGALPEGTADAVWNEV